MQIHLILVFILVTVAVAVNKGDMRFEGWRHVKVTDRHTAVDYARVLKDLADIHFAHAKTIVLGAGTSSSPSAAPRRLDRGDVDFLHSHHRIETALCFIAAAPASALGLARAA